MAQKQTEVKKKTGIKTRGGRNLVLLGLISTLIAMSTTGVSLAIYHNSGDIYLDRSRPGYLPDEEEIEDDDEEEPEVEYELGKSGKVTKEVLDEYLVNLKEQIEEMKSYIKPFEAGVLTDEHLGITEPKVENTEVNGEADVEVDGAVENTGQGT